MVEDGSRSACGEYPHYWPCRSFLLTLETWHEQRYANEFLSGVPTDCELESLPAKRANVSGGALVGGVSSGRVGMSCPLSRKLARILSMIS